MFDTGRRTTYTRAETVLEIVSILGVVFGALVAILHWQHLPVTIPSHFDIAGRTDSYGPKWTLLIPPGIACLIYLLFTAITYFGKPYTNAIVITDENRDRQLRIGRSLMQWLKAEVIWLFVLLEWQIIRIALGQASSLGFMLTWGDLIILFGTALSHLVLAFRAQ